MLRAVLALLLLAAPAAAEPLKVVASMGVLADMVACIGGPDVAVRSLVPPNGDAHVYQPTPADASAVSGARVMVMNGLGLEGWIDRLARAADFKGEMVVAAEGVTTVARSDGRPTPDPHAWQDPAMGAVYIRNILQGLVKADPARKAVYEAGAQAYAARLAALDGEIRQRMAAIPEARRRVITSHDAFRYFGRAYGIEFLAPVGISTESEASATMVAKLIRQMKRERIEAIFVETISDPRLMAQLAKEAGAVVGGALYSDALSPPGGPADSYLSMLSHNATLLADAMSK